jgi:TPR repeat protein
MAISRQGRRRRPFLLSCVLVGLFLLSVLPAPAQLFAQSQKAAGWRDACDKGSTRDCVELAKGHLQAKEGLNRDPTEAARRYARACELGAAAACQEYGEMLLAGTSGISIDSAAALDMLTRACDLDPDGKSGGTVGIGGRNRCQGAVDIYLRRDPLTRADSVRAKRILKLASARNEQARGLLRGWRNFPDSLAWPDSTKRRLKEEEEAAQARVDSMRTDSLRRADSVAKRQRERVEEAATRIERSADRRRNSLLRGTYRRGCDAGDAKSCDDLADLYSRGLGGPANPAQADTLRARACQLDPKYCKA